MPEHLAGDDLVHFDFHPGNVLVGPWAHMSLRMADWSIRHLSAADTAAWLDVAEELMPRC